MSRTAAVHGGPDALGVPRYDFSSNSNACGPCPQALAALQTCDARHYPDPAYTALRQQLADFHGVDAWRVLLAGSASEFIYRMTAWVAQAHGGAEPARVWLPRHAYGDYLRAALAWGCVPTASLHTAQLAWACDPSSPLGTAHTDWPQGLRPLPGGAASLPASPSLPHWVLDCAYAPLRLSGVPIASTVPQDRVWQLWTPNKALGLTGVRAAYAIAPLHAGTAVRALNGLCPSWPVGAHGVALLHSWVQPDVQAWLAQSRTTLTQWKARQLGLLEDAGWTCLPSDSNFFCARPLGDAPVADLSVALAALRSHGVKLRDAASFGLPGHVRVSVQPPVAQDALVQAWQRAQLSTQKDMA